MTSLFQFTLPTDAQLDKLITIQQDAELTYNKNNIKGYDKDINQIFLGNGEDVWAAAKQAMADWSMFPDGWARIYYQKPIFTEGDIVVMCAHVLGIWWLNASRILYVLDDEHHFGFAYGTLPNHVESGEELFQVTRNEHGDIYYSISAFSRPRFWPVRLTYPLSRLFQKKFIKDSMQKVKNRTYEQFKIKYS